MAWKKELQDSMRTIDDLEKVVSFSASERSQIAQILERSPMLVTPHYLSLIDFSDEHDPIRKMALPCLEESDLSGSLDTSGEYDNTVIRGLQHKYHETVLLLTTSLCATYCRHCFRKRFVGLHDDDSLQDLEAARAYISEHTEVKNVLISGGDALLNTNEHLRDILEMLVDIEHLDYIRVASRTPVTLPSRINDDPALLDMLEHYSKKKQIIFVTQFDHASEVVSESKDAVQAIRERSIPVRNQTVLLRGVNDSPEALSKLMSKLLSIGVEPYYVFQCRPVSGVKSLFQVPLKEGYEIVEAAKGMQSGLGKSFRYCLSHVRGKLEILGTLDNGEMLFKYHEAKDRSNLGKLFTQDISDTQAWLD
ncbi:MAG: KamA family radical SAM protein [Raoultibacter sp.]|jgi:lysine 2,3-aminomutase